MRKVIFYGFLPVMLTLISVHAFARYNVSPKISIMETYNDNIFLDSENEEDDFITTVSPHITFSFSSGKALDLSLYYGLNFRFYDHHSNLNDEEIDEAQEIDFASHIKPSNIIFIDVLDSYERVPVDIRRSSALDNVYENITNRNMFEASPYLILPLMDTLTATIGYRYENIYYRDKDSSDLFATLVDSETHSAFLTIDKKLSPRMDGAVKYAYFAYRPDLNDAVSSTEVVKYDRHEASIEIDYKIIPAVMITGGVGETWFNYDSIDENRQLLWNIGISNIIKLTKSTSLGGNYGIRFLDSINSGALRSKDINLHFKTGIILKFEIEPYYQHADYLTAERKDKIIGVTFKLSRPFTKRSDISIDGKLEKVDFEPEDQNVRRYSFGSNLSHRFSSRLRISLGYRFNHQNASSDVNSGNLAIRDYKNNIGWLQAKLSF